jgi:hypothetical protein
MTNVRFGKVQVPPPWSEKIRRLLDGVIRLVA